MRALKLAPIFVLVISLQAKAQIVHGSHPWQWMGCYELRVAPADQTKEIAGAKIPRRFQLVWKRASADPESFELKALDLPEGWWWLSSWNLRYDDKLEVHWSTGFVGYSLIFTGTGNEFTGLVQPYTDTDDPKHPPPSFQVEVRHTTCDRGLRK